MVRTVTGITFKDIAAHIYDKGTKFGIDAAIRELAKTRRSAHLQSRWTNNEDAALAFGRRLLEASAIMAGAASEADKSATIDDLEKLENLALAAGNELRRLLLHIANGTPSRTWPVDADGNRISIQSLINSPLNHVYFRDAVERGDRPDGKATLARAKRDCQILCDAGEILGWLKDYGKRTRDVVAGTYQNPGFPEKRAFARYMMEGWIFLVGTAPSENSVAFSNFLTTGWGDVCDTDAGDWRHSIREARRSIAASDEVTLQANGPDWA